MKKKSTTIDWENLSKDQLLQVRIKDLGLHIAGSALEPLIQRLYQELEANGIDFRPPYYLADEWLCPDKEPIIGIPFCLSHPRLKSIEIEMMFEAEGDSPQSCIKLLRHECGHAINYAYKLYTRTRWRELFGSFSTKYSDIYRYQPYSKRFVVHLDDHYAQAHPDEDFAETFAVWLAPESSWRQKYGKWPAFQKLLYVDSLMKRIGHQRPVVTAQPSPPWAACRMRSTLASYYERKRNCLGSQFKGYYDDSLKVVFSTEQKSDVAVSAAKILRKYKRGVIDNLATWTGHRKFDLHKLINRIIERCEANRLYAADNPRELIGITTFLAAIACGTGHLSAQGRK
ncbi:MAG: putative zinc-binding metallopeptidase [Phycisphaerae bacterium]|nr:putative zinc-binding metallopeptidase [Phycisphaerae bacterium]